MNQLNNRSTDLWINAKINTYLVRVRLPKADDAIAISGIVSERGWSGAGRY